MLYIVRLLELSCEGELKQMNAEGEDELRGSKKRPRCKKKCIKKKPPPHLELIALEIQNTWKAESVQ